MRTLHSYHDVCFSSAAFQPKAWTYTCEEENSRCMRVALEGDEGATDTGEARCKLECKHEGGRGRVRPKRNQ